jgi:photosystem II stability/assembly factor-like uncharacterized protein
LKSLLLYFFLLLSFFSSAQWVPQNSGTGDFLYQIHFLNKDTGFVTQETGVIRRTINGGANWNIIYSGVNDVYHLSFCSPLNAIGSGYGQILNTWDGGQNWTVQYSESGYVFSSVSFPSAIAGYVSAAGSNTSKIIKTIDGGDSWSVVDTLISSARISGIQFINQDTGFAVFEILPLFGRTYDGGVNWTYDTIPSIGSSFYGLHFSSQGIGYLCGDGGEVFKTTDFGYNWSDVTDPNNSLPLYSIHFTSADTGYVVGGDGWSSGVILKTTNGGTTWTNTPFLSQTYNSVFFPTSNVGYTCGTGGSIRKYDQPVSIFENESIDIYLYPNPTKDIIHIKSKTPSDYSILTSVGNQIESGRTSSPEQTINLSNYPRGIYFVKITQGDKVSTKKIILI